MQYVGLGKTLFNSSVALLRPIGARPEIEVALTERLNRKKASGLWPERAIRVIEGRLADGHESEPRGLRIGENRDVNLPSRVESTLNTHYPFFEHVKKIGMEAYVSSLNPALRFVTHHRAHARSAQLLSPFSKALILVMDGAGTSSADFEAGSAEARIGNSSSPEVPVGGHEEYSVYLLDGSCLTPVAKGWQVFRPSVRWKPHTFSEGLGTLYEKSAEFIFNDKRASGKVMGLAALGTPSPIRDRTKFLEELPWERAFSGSGKKDWEASGRIGMFSDLAASVQEHFETRVLDLAGALREAHPEYGNLVLSGGCALNCTANMKLAAAGHFDEIYVPPFPGDECIGLGVAAEFYYSDPGTRFVPLRHEEQHGYYGPRTSVPSDSEIESAMGIFELVKPLSIAEHAAELLEEGKILGWFQGRSESGPRALGNRSILARPDLPGLKNHLNRKVKFREAFRPYGASVPHEKAHEYFAVTKGFNNPYMSFAVKTRAEHRERLAEVTHLDGTCRMQTVREGQNPLFHELLHRFGRKTDLFCLLNTSLNVMGEPIVETLEDAKQFLLGAPVDGLVIGGYFARKC